MKMPMTRYRGFELHCASTGRVLIYRFDDSIYFTIAEDLDDACRECDYLIDFFGVGKETKR